MQFTVTINSMIWDDGRRVYDGPLLLASDTQIKLTDRFDVTKKDGKYKAKEKELKTLDKTYLLSSEETAKEELFITLI